MSPAKSVQGTAKALSECSTRARKRAARKPTTVHKPKEGASLKQQVGVLQRTPEKDATEPRPRIGQSFSVARIGQSFSVALAPPPCPMPVRKFWNLGEPDSSAEQD